MKIIPQDRIPPVFPKSCVENINFPDAINRYGKKKPTPKTSVTFIGSEPVFEKLSEISPSPTFEPRFCPSLNLLIRSGLCQNSDIFVLAEPVHVAETEDVGRILSSRCQTKIKIILWDDEKSADDLTQAILDATEEIEFFNAKESITEDIIKCSQESQGKERDNEPAQHPESKSNRSITGDLDTLDEEEFRKIIRIKLENHLDSSPDNILSRAIDIIKS
jgi:hypothetical protein